MGRRKKSQNKEIAERENKEPLSELLSAIKSDDDKLFSELVTQNKSYLNLCFGRFPLLSLCYLYKSKKIAAAYEKSLLNFTAYVYADEDYESYRLFRKYAKRCLRFYISDKNLVTPLEMLAMRGDSLYLSEKYGDAQKDAKTVNRIRDIYRMLHSQDIDITSASIAIKRKPLSRKQKYRIFAAVIAATLISALCGASWWGFSALGGRGTAESPYEIMGEKQLKTAIGKDAHIALAKDFSLTEKWEPSDFKGSIDGNGHTVFVKKNMAKGFVKTLEGKLENINFVFEDFDMQITENTALVAKTNNGLITNVNIKVSGKFVTNIAAGTEGAPVQPTYLSLLAYENNGEITDCKVDAKVFYKNTGGNDTFLSGIVSLNNGIIKDCLAVEGGEFLTDTVDTAAIAAENKLNATVSGCANYAEVSQSTANANWLPNVGGIVLSNYGTVTDCINNGSISAVSTATEKVLNVYAGGVVCINTEKIIKCKNDADISAQSQNFNIYAGGVAALNSGSIDNSCAYGKISVEAVGEGAFLFAGAIAGSLSGGVTNSYAAATFHSVGQNVYLGGIIGVAEYFSALSSNNYYVGQSNITYGVASILSGSYVYAGADSGVTKVTSIDEIKAVEGVYWG